MAGDQCRAGDGGDGKAGAAGTREQAGDADTDRHAGQRQADQQGGDAAVDGELEIGVVREVDIGVEAGGAVQGAVERRCEAAQAVADERPLARDLAADLEEHPAGVVLMPSLRRSTRKPPLTIAAPTHSAPVQISAESAQAEVAHDQHAQPEHKEAQQHAGDAAAER